MCTVTIVPRVDAGGVTCGLRMVCNRDESRGRRPAQPPTPQAFGRRQALLPIDADAGGTWVAVNDAGVAFTLLNRNPQDMRGVTFPGRATRGSIIPSLLDTGSLDQARGRIRRLDAAGFAPFRLVLADQREVLIGVCEDDRLREERFPLVGPVMFTSSGLGDAWVEPPRRALFAGWFGADAADWPGRQDTFHTHRWDDQTELSVCMSRPDALSVSLTRVEVSPRQVTLTYHGAPPDEPDDEVTLSLPRSDA